MPNWCYNTATLHHDDKAKIDAFEAELQKEDNQPLNHLRPNPAGEWNYGWSVDNWGTKWDVSIMDWEREDDNTIVMHFDSAWSPPIALYEFLETEGWTVRALYHEPGIGFVGKFEDGFDDYYELDWTDREALENLPEDLADFANVWDDLERYEEEQMEEELQQLERTDWFDVSVNPVRVGRYEVETEAWPYPQYSNWDGKKWGRWEDDDAVITKWRGLAEEYWDAAAALDKIIEDSKV
jgi:hypothetical protein